MMEKDLNEQQLDKLIRDWTDGLLPTDIDDQMTDSLLNFVADDDTALDVNELLDFHIHELAMNENLRRRSKWKIIVSSVAAASVAILIVASMFIPKREYDTLVDEKTFVVQNQDKERPIVVSHGLPETNADSSNTIPAGNGTKEKYEVPSKRRPKRNDAEKVMSHQEEASEKILTEAIAEINAGFTNMVDNANESLYMTNVSMLPVSLLTNYNESESYESIPDEGSSRQINGQLQKLNIIETNLVNTLYEIRNLNIDLNFKTDNKNTEI